MDAQKQGTLRIGQQCVFIQDEDGKALVVWPADRTTWNADAEAIMFEDADAGTVRLTDGDRVISGGGSDKGGSSAEEWVPVDWVSPPTQACETDVRWILGGIRKDPDGA